MIIVGQKLITALSLVLAFTLVFSAQVSFANFGNNHHPNPPTPTPTTSPMTGPITGPVTGPITGPAIIFTISGNVTDHIFKLFKKSYNRLVPEAGAKVKAKDIFSGHSATATTDANGNYVINVGKKGFYKVSVVDGDAKFYTPPLHFVHLTNEHPTKSNVNFQGHIFSF